MGTSTRTSYNYPRAASRIRKSRILYLIWEQDQVQLSNHKYHYLKVSSKLDYQKCTEYHREYKRVEKKYTSLQHHHTERFSIYKSNFPRRSKIHLCHYLWLNQSMHSPILEIVWFPPPPPCSTAVISKMTYHITAWTIKLIELSSRRVVYIVCIQVAKIHRFWTHFDDFT